MPECKSNAYNTSSSDFQINADPLSTCQDDGVAFTDPECDAVAGNSPTGGRGASDFMLIDSNFFHHSKAQGPNFTSVRNSLIKNNIFALPARHGASFWQETDNPKLGASNNFVALAEMPEFSWLAGNFADLLTDKKVWLDRCVSLPNAQWCAVRSSSLSASMVRQCSTVDLGLGRHRAINRL